MSLVTRRGFAKLVAASAAMASGPLRAAPPAVPERALGFTVHRNECAIGRHEVRFEQAGDDLVVHIDVHMRVGFGPITFFRYHHQGEERWSGGRFVSLRTQTDNNGELLRVSALRTDRGVRVEATGQATQVLPGDALPLTHWNVAAMSARLFNPQDGKVLQEVSRRRGVDMVSVGDGKRVQAVRYSLDGKMPIDDWYDEAMVWTALQARVKDGSILRYVRDA